MCYHLNLTQANVDFIKDNFSRQIKALESCLPYEKFKNLAFEAPKILTESLIRL